MNAEQVRALNDEALHKELLALTREAFNLRMQMGTGQLSQPSQVKRVRRDIARVKTILNERKRAEAAS